ncbi:MFS transporter [Maribellus sediminis]|uniref:MFS transporter n=1 Tax=Maribellus sediminis TaxID=2696285 RepID=UPI00143104CC|nr:MFS transporter [Maribellus sediminis]
MKESKIRVYPYRWTILLLYFLITVIIEIQWLNFASISTVAQEFYGTSALRIDFLSMIFMIVFIVMSIPASYVLDTWGLKKGLMIGAVLTGIFGIVKSIGANNLLVVTLAQSGLAVAQPFILNAVTKVGAKWFPVQERATVAGLGSLAQYVGIIIALAVTPLLISEVSEAGFGISRILWIYGIASVLGAILVLLFMKEEPPTPPSDEEFTARISPIAGIKDIFSKRDMKFLLLLFFIGLGIFNAVSTCIDQICKDLTVEETGLVGGVMLIGGVLGALILPALSDKMRKRKPFIILCMILMLPGLIGLTLFSSFVPMMISAFIFGFFIMSAGPIGFQYGAEKSYPAPESTSQGIILLMGQVSGILFVFGLNKTGVLVAMLSFVLLTVFNVFVSTRLKESISKFL